MDRERNLAFIDGQNLYTWIKNDWWKVNLSRFRIYLKDKLKIKDAFYYIWYYDSDFADIYQNIIEAWFNVIFKQQTKKDISQKKWNVDSDMIFWVMRELIENPNKFDQIVIVSWDGDFKILVDYLICKWRFNKILLPNKQFASSTYKKLPPQYYDYMIMLKNKIQ